MELSEWLAVAIAIAGWIFGYISSSKLNLKNKKKEMRIQYLIEVYETLSNSCLRMEYSPDIEMAVTKIQLFGSEEQIKLTHDFLTEFSQNYTATYDELLQKLRDDLRRELNLSNLKNRRILHLRVRK